MTISIPLDRMTLAEKLQVMETIWADLTKIPEDLSSPAWHAQVLAERRKLVSEGKLQFQDWDMAMKDLRDQLHANKDS